MRILHIGAWGRNWGDHAIGHAMHAELEQVAAEKRLMKIDWDLVDIQATDFAGFDFDPFDMVIVGGGGLLWDKPELESYTGWQWRIPASELLAIRPPLVLYGLGYTAFPYHDRTDKELMWSHLRIATAHAKLTSVRNSQTRRILKQHGIADVHNIPDPALELPVANNPERLFTSFESAERTIGLCWASDKPAMRFGNDTRYEHWLESYAAYLARVVGEEDRVLMIEHIADMDADARDVFRQHLGDRLISCEERGWLRYHSSISHGGPVSLDAPNFFSVYDECDAVFSSRKHGVWIPAGKRIPTLGFGMVQEVGWTLESVGMGRFDINPVDLDMWKEATAAMLDQAIAEGAAAYDRSLPPLRRALTRFNAKVVALL